MKKVYQRHLFIIVLVLISNLAFAGSMLQKCKGEVVITRDRTSLEGKKGTVLYPGDTIRTGPDGYAGIRLEGSGFVHMKPETQFLIPAEQDSDKGISVIRMLKGLLWVKARKRKDSLRVMTPNAICGVRGTEFIMEVDHEVVRLSVGEGQVAFVPVVKGMVPKAFLLEAGDEISFEPLKMFQTIEDQAEESAKRIEKRLLQSGEEMESKLEKWGKEKWSQLLEFGNKAEDVLENEGRKLSQKVIGWAGNAEARMLNMVPETMDQAIRVSLQEDIYTSWKEYDFTDAGIKKGRDSSSVYNECQEFSQIFEQGSK